MENKNHFWGSTLLHHRRPLRQSNRMGQAVYRNIRQRYRYYKARTQIPPVPQEPHMVKTQFKQHLRRNNGSYDGAEICELVGLFILNSLQTLFDNDVGLYRDMTVLLC